MESKVGPDMTEVRLLVQFRMFRVQSVCGNFRMILRGFVWRSLKIWFCHQNILYLIQQWTWTRKIQKNQGQNLANRAPLRGPQGALVRVTLDLLTPL